MTEQRAPHGTEWGGVIDVLHLLGNMITVRSHYTEGHPAIAQADENAANAFPRVLERIPDLVVALVDGEFIVCERPLPDLRAKLHVLADAMTRHEIECLVFQRGVTPAECKRLGGALALPADAAGRVREQTQADLMHILLRFVVRSGDHAAGAGTSTSYMVPPVQDALVGVARALAHDGPIDKLGVLAVANQLVIACVARSGMIQQRSWTRSIEDEATHAANVATMTAMMALDAGYPHRVCIDATAAALLHDIGHLFLPEEIRGVPEPLLDDRAKPVFRNHTFAGAAMLLGAGCSPLWVAAALEHHRGVDALGYPALDAADPPHELVRFIALANFFDRKRTLLQGRADSPDDALRAAMALESRYFGPGLLRRFLKVIGVFPPGTTVELTSLEPAVVTRANPGDPWRPQVRILRGPNRGKLVELRDIHPVEARHRLSIVRAIPPPLLVLADAVIEVPKAAEIVVPEMIFVPAPAAAAPVEIAARDAQDRARASLGGMDAMLDALLTVPTEALVSAMPPAMSRPPRALSAMSIPPYAAPSHGSSQPPVKDHSSQQPPAMPRRPSIREEPPMSQPPPMARPPTMSRPPTLTRPPTMTVPPLIARPPPSMAPPPVATRPAAARPSSASATSPQSMPPSDPQELEKALIAKLGSVEKVPVLVADVTKLNLDHRAAFVLRFMDGMSTVEDILDASGLPRIDVLRVLDDLLTRAVIAMR